MPLCPPLESPLQHFGTSVKQQKLYKHPVRLVRVLRCSSTAFRCGAAAQSCKSAAVRGRSLLSYKNYHWSQLSRQWSHIPMHTDKTEEMYILQIVPFYTSIKAPPWIPYPGKQTSCHQNKKNKSEQKSSKAEKSPFQCKNLLQQNNFHSKAKTSKYKSSKAEKNGASIHRIHRSYSL